MITKVEKKQVKFINRLFPTFHCWVIDLCLLSSSHVTPQWQERNFTVRHHHHNFSLFIEHILCLPLPRLSLSLLVSLSPFRTKTEGKRLEASNLFFTDFCTNKRKRKNINSMQLKSEATQDKRTGEWDRQFLLETNIRWIKEKRGNVCRRRHQT